MAQTYMDFILVLLLLMTLNLPGQVDSQEGCDRDMLPSPCEPNQKYPSHVNCRNYYKCSETSELRLRECPSGRYFYSDIQKCKPVDPSRCAKPCSEMPTETTQVPIDEVWSSGDAENDIIWLETGSNNAKANSSSLTQGIVVSPNQIAESAMEVAGVVTGKETSAAETSARRSPKPALVAQVIAKPPASTTSVVEDFNQDNNQTTTEFTGEQTDAQITTAPDNATQSNTTIHGLTIADMRVSHKTILIYVGAAIVAIFLLILIVIGIRVYHMSVPTVDAVEDWEDPELTKDIDYRLHQPKREKTEEDSVDNHVTHL